MLPLLIERFARVVRKPPGVIVERLHFEYNARADRFLGPRRGRKFDDAALLIERWKGNEEIVQMLGLEVVDIYSGC